MKLHIYEMLVKVYVGQSEGADRYSETWLILVFSCD